MAVFGVLLGGFLKPCGRSASRGVFWRLEGSRGTPRMSFWHTQASVWRVSGLSVSGCLLGGKVVQKTSKMASFWSPWGSFWRRFLTHLFECIFASRLLSPTGDFGLKMLPKCRVGLPIGGQNAPQDPPKISAGCPPGASWRPLKSDQHATSALDGFWSAFLVPLGLILAPSWLYLGPSWPQFGHLGLNLAPVTPPWRHLGGQLGSKLRAETLADPLARNFSSTVPSSCT